MAVSGVQWRAWGESLTHGLTVEPLVRWQTAPGLARADAFHEKGTIGIGGWFCPRDIQRVLQGEICLSKWKMHGRMKNLSFRSRIMGQDKPW